MIEGKIFKVVSREIKEFKKNLYQKSVDFRDNHIFPIDNFSELEQKIKEGTRGLFLVPFCNNLDCEIEIKKKVPSYSIRCVASEKQFAEPPQCLFCQSAAQNRVYLGRSY
jgi:prolyl-tRNA synthetase